MPYDGRGSRKGLTQHLVCITMQRANRRTKRSNRVPPLLPRNHAPETPPIRGPARLLRRGALLPGGRRRLWLLGGRVPRAVSSFSPRPAAGVLRGAAARPADAAEKISRAGRDHRAPQTELLGLRDQRDVTGARAGLESDGRPRGAQGGGVRAAAAAPG